MLIIYFRTRILPTESKEGHLGYHNSTSLMAKPFLRCESGNKQLGHPNLGPQFTVPVPKSYSSLVAVKKNFSNMSHTDTLPWKKTVILQYKDKSVHKYEMGWKIKTSIRNIINIKCILLIMAFCQLHQQSFINKEFCLTLSQV